jgi:hypothetical protein
MKQEGKEHCHNRSMKPELHSSQNWKIYNEKKKEENHRQISLKNLDAKILNTGKQNSTTYQKDHVP